VLDAAGARAIPDEAGQVLGTSPAAEEPDRTPADPIVTVDVPGLLADHLRETTGTAAREALHRGWTIRRGRGATRCA
jgi:putative DNA-invertase from lambdoid prophage Rac